MGHERLANALKRRSATLDGQGAETHVGKITSVGPDGTTARVSIMPDGVLTGWLPVGGIGVGANAIIAPPNIDDLVVVEPHEGDAENWIITKRLFSTAAPPPNSPATGNPVKPGELAIVMGCGSYLHFTNDGTVYGKAATSWQLHGDLHVVDGDIYDKHGSIDRLRTNYDSHTHTDPQGGVTGPPSATDPE